MARKSEERLLTISIGRYAEDQYVIRCANERTAVRDFCDSAEAAIAQGRDALKSLSRKIRSEAARSAAENGGEEDDIACGESGEGPGPGHELE